MHHTARVVYQEDKHANNILDALLNVDCKRPAMSAMVFSCFIRVPLNTYLSATKAANLDTESKCSDFKHLFRLCNRNKKLVHIKMTSEEGMSKVQHQRGSARDL